MANTIKIKQIDQTQLAAFVNDILDGTGAVYTANRALVTDGSGDVTTSSVTATELGYLSGVTSAIQTQLDAKQATITGAATTITSSNLTVSRALISNASGKVAASSVTDTELGYVSGVTSAIQTQFSNLGSTYLALTGGTLTGSLTMGGTITASTPLLINHTWNNSGVGFQCVDVNITNSASDSSSNFIRVQLGGSQIMKLTKTGRFELGAGGASAIFDGAGNSVIGSYLWLTGAELRIEQTGSIGFSSSGLFGSPDINFYRRSSGILSQRAGATAQTYELYGVYTDSSNYVRASLSATSTSVTLAAETAGTGADDIDIAITPAGTGLLKFGSHSSIAAETVTGYITIKDSGGTSRKIAVVS